MSAPLIGDRGAPLVEVRGVSHQRGSGAAATWVLQDLDLSLHAAALTVLAGRSGSGKSTLCHLIAGVMAPTAGRVLVAGKPTHPTPDWATVSLLPQRLALAPELSVAENVLLPAGVRGLSPLTPSSVAPGGSYPGKSWGGFLRGGGSRGGSAGGGSFPGSSAIGGLLSRLGLDAIAGRAARETSLGEQQRTALARALVLSPAVAVLDEPTAHQDDDHVHLVLDALTAAVDAGTLAIVATHDQRVIDAAATVIRMHSGRIESS